MQFLIDECLTVRLVDVANGRGWRAAHVAHIGLSGVQDRHLMPTILTGDWTFVTRNAVDFRGSRPEQARGGLYSDVTLHAGLICLTGLALSGQGQVELFEAVLEQIGREEPVNTRIEARVDGSDFVIDVYPMP